MRISLDLSFFARASSRFMRIRFDAIRHAFAALLFAPTIASRSREAKLSPAPALIGKPGIAVSAVRGHGTVMVDGNLWRSCSPDPLEPGQAIVVKGVNGIALEVEPEIRRVES